MKEQGERLQKVLARRGVASRRKAEALILAGRVTVNGERAELGMRVSSEDEVRVDGAALPKEREPITLMLNKPPGYVCSAEDELGRETVMELVPDIPGLHPVGRLDRDSEGLLLLTTDGELTQRLTHPSFEKEKGYRVWCREGTLSAGALAALERGVLLDDGPARADLAKLAEGGCIVVLHEGRKRQVRRMLAAVGCKVVRLLRTRIGGLELGDLPSGSYRELTAEDLAKLGYTPKRA